MYVPLNILKHSLTLFQFTVQDIPATSNVITPRVNLLPQRGTVPRPPPATTPSLGSRSTGSHIQVIQSFLYVSEDLSPLL